MRALDLKVPPTIVALLTGVTMWLVTRARPAMQFRLPGRTLLAAALAVAGCGIVVLAVIALRRARTTLNPTRPGKSECLVTSGIYAWTRNPMYLGLLLWLAGLALMLGSPIALLGLLAFFGYMTRYQIIPEERAFAARFGPVFTSYTSRVRRWL